MKINKILILLFIIICILIAGYFFRSIPDTIVVKPATPDTIPVIPIPTSNLPQTTIPVTNPLSSGATKGQILLSIGEYYAQLPVFVDNTPTGNVSNDKPLNLVLSVGSHVVKVCAPTLCERADVEIVSDVKTTINFQKKLDTDLPQGFLSISIGDYPDVLPVFIDDIQVDVITSGGLVNRTLNAGNHTVGICTNVTCFNESIGITPSSLTSLDFEKQLEQEVPQGSLRVSIGGYNAKLPVLLDNVSVGNVSMGSFLDLKTDEGNHTVTVCVGNVCEHQDVQVRFAKQTLVDFEEQLKKDVEFPTPTLRILHSSLSYRTMTVDVEFINPDATDHTMKATVSCTYSYTDSQNVRKIDIAASTITKTVKAGSRSPQRVSLSLSSGSNIIASEPVLVGLTIT